MALRKVWLNINGAERMLVCDPEKDTLAEVLRRIGLTGTKVGCGTGVCGACTVILDGELVRSCIKKIRTSPSTAEVLTIEGIGTPTNLHPIQQAWITYGGVQCGFCSPASSSRPMRSCSRTSDPTREEVRDWFPKQQNVCRCCGWKQMVDCVMEGAAVMRGEETIEDISFKTRPTAGSTARPCRVPTRSPRSAASPTTATTSRSRCRRGRSTSPSSSRGSTTRTSRASTPPRPRDAGRREGHHRQGHQGHQPDHVPAAHPRAKYRRHPRPIICDKKVFRYGDVVAVVAADTKDQARAAAKKVKVDIEQLPAYMNYLDAVAPGACRIHPAAQHVRGGAGAQGRGHPRGPGRLRATWWRAASTPPASRTSSWSPTSPRRTWTRTAC